MAKILSTCHGLSRKFFTLSPRALDKNVSHNFSIELVVVFVQYVRWKSGSDGSIIRVDPEKSQGPVR
jgi:hypothetical protein